MPREEEKDSLSTAKQSPEPANESSQSPEPVSEIGDSAENRESSVETRTEEASSNYTQSPRDSTSSQSVSEESICSRCGGRKVKSDENLELLSVSKSDEDLEEVPVSSTDEDLEEVPVSSTDEDLEEVPVSSTNEDLEKGTVSSGDEDLEKEPVSQHICKCGPEQDETLEEEIETLQETDAGVQETGDTAAEGQSLVVPEETSTEVPTEQEVSSDSVEETSGSTTSDSPSENFAIFTCVRPKPLSLAGPVQQRRRYEPQSDEVSIPLQERPLLAAVQVEENIGGRPPASGESSGVDLSSAESNVRNLAGQSHQSASSSEYKSILRVVGCVIVLVFTVVFALLISAQLSFNRRLGIGNNSTKDLDRNSTAGDE